MNPWLGKNELLKHLHWWCIIFAVCASCTQKQTPILGLVQTERLGTTRSHHFLRVLTHFHSPYSYDACDDNGLIRWDVNQKCLDDVREAICVDHEDVVFATDHPNNMARYPYESLLMHREGDEWILGTGGKKVGNRIHCPDGYTSDWYPGMEGRLLALGMQSHSSESQDERINLYNGEDLRTKAEIEQKTHGLIAIPHTESRTLEYLEKIRPAAIEIYNFHAYMDPKILKTYLHLSPFHNPFAVLKYLIDPFHFYDANYMFEDLGEMSPVYFQKWDALQAKGILATGLAGADSHETIFKLKMSDGQRLDHHRRTIRFFSNFVLTEKNDEDSVKAAIVHGRVYFVIESLGTPLGLDFYVKSADAQAKIIAEMGDQIKESPQSMIFHLPSLFPAPELDQDAASPEIWAELIRVDDQAKETVVMQSQGAAEFIYPNPSPGHYRVQVWMKPRHLKNHLSSSDLAEKPFIWVISNPIHIGP